MRGAGPVCAGDWVGLRVLDGDGVGGLMAVEMVKYTKKNERIMAELRTFLLHGGRPHKNPYGG